MLQGLYESASGLLAMQQLEQDAAVNTANANTPGFQQEIPAFNEFLAGQAELVAGNQVTGTVGGFALGVGVQAVESNTTPGAIVVTGRNLDVAPSPGVWLEVRTPAGVLATRDGQLQVNQAGVLVSSTGYPVVAVGGGIIRTQGATGLGIATDGTVSQNGAAIGQILLQTVGGNAQDLRPSAQAGLYTVGAGARLAAGGGVTPGAYVASNATLNRTAVQLEQALSGYQANEEVQNVAAQDFMSLMSRGLTP